MSLIVFTAIGLDVSITTLAVGHTDVDVFNVACIMASSNNVQVSLFLRNTATDMLP